jgi:hypothetical protein
MTKKIILIGYLLFSTAIIIYGFMFVVSQMVNLKYYFESNLPTSSNSCYPFDNEFILEIIQFAKIIIFYAFWGLFLSIYLLWDKKRNK